MATLLVALVFAGLLPACLGLMLVLLSGFLPARLLWSVLFVPVLGMIAVWTVFRTAFWCGLVVGAAAVRWPATRWPRVAAGGIAAGLGLVVLHAGPWFRLLERGALLLTDGISLRMLDTVAPVLAAMLAARLVPNRLVRRLAGS